MFRRVIKLLMLLDTGHRKKIIQLQIIIIGASILELASVFSVGLVFELLATTNASEPNSTMASILLVSENWLGSEKNLLVFVAMVIFFSGATSFYCMIYLSFLSQRIGARLSLRLLSSFLSLPWEEFRATDSSSQINKVSAEVNRITTQVITASLQFHSRVILIFIVAGGLFFANPLLTTIIGSTFFLIYVCIYFFVGKGLKRNGEILTVLSKEKVKAVQEGIFGYREILLAGKSRKIINQFGEVAKGYGEAVAKNQFIAQTPKYIIETTILLLLILAVAFNLNTGGTFLTGELIVFAAAAMKLLPALQLIYGAVVAIRANINSFASIEDDLIRSQLNVAISGATNLQPTDKHDNFIFQSLDIKNGTIGFNNSGPLLENFCFSMKRGEKIGVIGGSGSGKSTLLDTLLGFKKLRKGEIYINGEIATSEQWVQFQKSIGYVGQDVYLFQGTLKENIAFSERSDDVCEARINFALQHSNLSSFVMSKPEGYDFILSERAANLSGGQRQRVAIARALDLNPQLIFFDDATSALDAANARVILETIERLPSETTVLMIAHKLTSLQNCDRLITIAN
jgi:HlyD family secretion protein